MIPILDTHQHLWNLDRFQLPWLKEGPLARTHWTQEYQAATAGLNVIRTVYMEVDVAHEQRSSEAEEVIALCERADNPMAGATIGGDPADGNFLLYLKRFESNPWVKGVRQVLHGDLTPDYYLSPAFIQGLRLLGQADLHFDLCMRSTELSQGARLLDLCPETRFVLDHCGNPDVQSVDREQWKRDLADLATRPNVVCKISGIVASAVPFAWRPDHLAPIIRHCAECFGSDRIFFGSDWPVCTRTATYRQWVEALHSIVADWSESDQRKLFYDNAARFYRIA